MKIIKWVIKLSLAISLFIGCGKHPGSTKFMVANQQGASTIYVDEGVDSLILWAVNDLVDDIEGITGNRPRIVVTNTVQNSKGIYIGEYKDSLLKSINAEQVSSLKGEWEKYHINTWKGNLIITGSDVRGTVFGIFEVAKLLGISPWKWWADVKPMPKEIVTLVLPNGGITEEPSVQYRGIFLNDEDWGLQPWAAKTFETETNDIGPKTYEKIFQLLLRLKANTVWPAMHPCTRGFYEIPGNNEIAKKYHIVVGTSHCEPMLRNNVAEWNTSKSGDFNYFTNKEAVCDYWQSRISEVSDAENIVTLGMRGIHDGHMYGGNSIEEKKDTLEKIIDKQRLMLSATKEKPIESIAQTIILYKEVLDIYNQNLKVPEDVTLMWCDDNHGYIRKLSNQEEQKRTGGSGVYYHLSYWGSPHDYLWLSSTQPAQIWYEMSKAYENGAKKIWIANVGDIKPTEYNMEFFLDLAWNIDGANNSNIKQHMIDWAAREFGTDIDQEVSALMNEYYRLASIRRPEFMGWSTVEPETQTRLSQFNSKATNNELERRILMYDNLSKKADELKEKVSDNRLDAWFQLIEYPVKCASLMNHKFLYAQLAQQSVDTLKRSAYANLSKNSYKQIKQLTSYYNEKMSGGKWKYMMSMSPRNLNVFDKPNNIIERNDTEIKPIYKPANRQQIFIQANEYKKNKGYNEYMWKAINGLGYSNYAITLFPFDMHYFSETKMPYVEYSFEAEQAGEFELKIKFLPTHSNNLDHQIKIQIDNEEKIKYSINTKGRSENWKENILRNSQIIKLHSSIKNTGKHTIKLYVNQTGIVIDQLSIDFAMDEPFYEIPF